MLFRRSELGLAAAAVIAVANAAPSEVINARDANVIVRNVDPCAYDRPIVPIHDKYGTGLLPKKVEDCIIKNMGPTFMNAFYNSYDSVDNSIEINGQRVNIEDSIVGNNNDGNVVGDNNIVGDNNTSVKGDGNALADISGNGDNTVGTGNGNGNGNIDGSNVNTTGTDNNGNENSGNDVKNSDNLVNNSTLAETGNDVKNSGNEGNAVNNDGNAIDNTVGNDGNALDSTVGNDGNTLDSNNGNTPIFKKRSLGQNCMSFKCLATINAVLPCIFAATGSSDHHALLKCGVPKEDICSCSSCLPEGIAEYVTDVCAAPLLNGVAHSEDLTDHAFAESSDNNVRAFLGLLTQSEFTAIKNYEARHAKQTGAESSCILGHKACGDSCACCLGTCGTLNGTPKCFGVC